MTDTEQHSDVAALTVELLSAYLANNIVASENLAELIRTTRAALTEQPATVAVAPESPAFVPAVSVRKSLASHEHILSLIDGKPYRTLKRHLASHGLTPASYRERYGLAANYPLVAPGFAEQRRAIAEKIGLGRRPAKPASPAVEVKEQAAQTQPSTGGVAKKTASSAAKAPKAAAGRRGTLKLFKENGEASEGKAEDAAPKPAKTSRAPKSAAKPKAAGAKPGRKAAAGTSTED